MNLEQALQSTPQPTMADLFDDHLMRMLRDCRKMEYDPATGKQVEAFHRLDTTDLALIRNRIRDKAKLEPDEDEDNSVEAEAERRQAKFEFNRNGESA